MYDVTAHAVRDGKTIEVTISGNLPDSCHQAKLDDIYPGGKRVYIVDPGAAQVFIEESVKPGSSICLMVLVPWATTVAIPDTQHKKVQVFVNNSEILEVPVVEKTSEFIVIALTSQTSGKPKGCSIIPKDNLYLAIYSKKFGPAPYDDCKKWVLNNCFSF